MWIYKTELERMSHICTFSVKAGIPYTAPTASYMFVYYLYLCMYNSAVVVTKPGLQKQLQLVEHYSRLTCEQIPPI